MDITVENIKCGGCANAIKNSLLSLENVDTVDVDVESGIVHIVGSDSIGRDKIISKLKSMGYPEPGKGSGITTATSYVSCMIGRVTS